MFAVLPVPEAGQEPLTEASPGGGWEVETAGPRFPALVSARAREAVVGAGQWTEVKGLLEAN